MFVQYMNVSFKGVMTASSDANEQLSTNVVNLMPFISSTWRRLGD